VIAVVQGDRVEALQFWNGLLQRGVYVNLMLPPATPDGVSLIRCSVSAAHSPAQIDAVCAAFADLRAAAGSPRRNGAPQPEPRRRRGPCRAPAAWSRSESSMKLFVAFSRAYPARARWCWARGAGQRVRRARLTTLLPLLGAPAGGAAGGAQSGVGGLVTRALGGIGLTPTVGVLLSIIVIAMTLKSALVLVANRQVGYTVAHVATDLRLGFIRSLVSARWEYYLRQPVGALANSLATEATRGAESYLYGATVIALAIQATVYSIVALIVSWQAALVALAAGAVFVFLLNRLVHMSRRAGAKQTRLLRSLLARLADNLQSVKPLKAMARENLANALLESDTTQLNRALQKEIFSKEALRALQERCWPS